MFVLYFITYNKIQKMKEKTDPPAEQWPQAGHFPASDMQAAVMSKGAQGGPTGLQVTVLIVPFCAVKKLGCLICHSFNQKKTQRCCNPAPHSKYLTEAAKTKDKNISGEHGRIQLQDDHGLGVSQSNLFFWILS